MHLPGRASGNRFAEQANVAEYWYSRNYEIWKTNVPGLRWTIDTARFSRYEYFVTCQCAMNQCINKTLFFHFFISSILHFFIFWGILIILYTNFKHIIYLYMKIRIRILLSYRQFQSLTKIKLLFNLNIKKITIIRSNKLKTLIFPRNFL